MSATEVIRYCILLLLYCNIIVLPTVRHDINITAMPSLIPPIFLDFVSPLTGSAISPLIKYTLHLPIARHLLHQHQSTHSRLCMRGARQPQYSDRYLLPHIFSLLILTIDFEKYCWLLSADFFAPCHPYISYLVTALEWYPMQFGYPPMFKARHN